MLFGEVEKKQRKNFAPFFRSEFSSCEWQRVSRIREARYAHVFETTHDTHICCNYAPCAKILTRFITSFYAISLLLFPAFVLVIWCYSTIVFINISIAFINFFFLCPYDWLHTYRPDQVIGLYLQYHRQN